MNILDQKSNLRCESIGLKVGQQEGQEIRGFTCPTEGKKKIRKSPIVGDAKEGAVAKFIEKKIQ